MTVHLSYEEAKAHLLALAAEHPNRVYENPDTTKGGCLYAHPDGPGCIVGHLFYRVGLSLTDVARLDGIGGIEVLVAEGDLVADERTERLLSETQGEQDGGVPWAEAVKRGIARAER